MKNKSHNQALNLSPTPIPTLSRSALTVRAGRTRAICTTLYRTARTGIYVGVGGLLQVIRACSSGRWCFFHHCIPRGSILGRWVSSQLTCHQPPTPPGSFSPRVCVLMATATTCARVAFWGAQDAHLQRMCAWCGLTQTMARPGVVVQGLGEAGRPLLHQMVGNARGV